MLRTLLGLPGLESVHIDPPPPWVEEARRDPRNAPGLLGWWRRRRTPPRIH